eukprot:4742497-Alexandrium_andersonii.AAC.1
MCIRDRLMTFTRQSNERIDDLITRFDVLKQRANDQGQLALSVEGLVWLLLRACQVSDHQLMTLLQPFGGRFPNTPAQYQQILVLLRRKGHILEHSPGNIAQQLRGPPRDSDPRAARNFFSGAPPSDYPTAAYPT